MRVALLAMLLAACIPASRAAGIRRLAEWRLSDCRKAAVFAPQMAECYESTRAYCRARELEDTCGEGWQR